jgi:hypothetical protein
MAESITEKFSTPSISNPLSPSPEKCIPKTNFLVRMLRKCTGFTKTYNIVFFSLTAGIFAAFCIARLPDLDFENVWSEHAGPGEWYWFRQGLLRIGMTVHLWSVLRKKPFLAPRPCPLAAGFHMKANFRMFIVAAGALMPLQFLPIIRRRYINFHRLNGRLLLFLLMIGNISKLNAVSYVFYL